MTSEFIASPPRQVPPPAVSDTVTGDGWWPDMSIAKFRDAMRLGTNITDARALEALAMAMLSAATALGAWRAARTAEGIAKLEDVPGDKIAGMTRAELLFRRIVHSFAAADLAETHNDISATEAGRERNEIKATSADEHRRNATIAIRDLLGKRRTRSALV